MADHFLFFRSIRVLTFPLLVMVLLFSLPARAQTENGIRGFVRDSSGTYLAGTTVSLFFQNDSAATQVVSTKSTGQYIFKNIREGKYYLLFTMAGRQTDRSGEILLKGNMIEMPDFILKPAVKSLRSVDINGTKKIVDIQAGKIVYQVENSIVSTGSSAYDILRKTPTVSTGQDDNLLVKGNSNINVMIDGKMTYLTGSQLTAMLRGMPSETIKSIEVLTIPPSQYDAAGTAGMINIITKRIRKKGYALNISSGFTGGRYGSTTQSILANISNARFNLYGGYTYNFNSGYIDRTSYRIVDTMAYNRHSFDPFQANNNSYKIGFDYYISRNQELGILYSGYSNSYRSSSTGPTYLENLKNMVDSVVQNHNLINNPSVNNSFDFNYVLRIDTLGKILTADFDYIHYNNNAFGTQGNQFFSPGGDSLQPFQELRYSQPTLISIRSAKLDLVLPYRELKFSTGAKYASVTTDNNFTYDSLLNNQFVHSDVLSNYFIYQENVAALYFSLAGKWNAFSLSAGLRAEYTHSLGNLVTENLKNENNYLNLFPFLSLSREISPEFKLDFAVDRRINRPVYADLNPAKFFRDKYVYFQGNPFLNPETAWNMSLSFSWLEKYLATYSFSITSNPMLTYAFQDSTGQLRITTLNFSEKKQMDLLISVPVKPFPFWEMQNAVDLNYITFNLLQEGEQSAFLVKSLSVDISSTQSFSIPGNIRAEGTIHYTSPATDGIYRSRYYFVVQAGLKKSFLHKKLDALISVSDIFKTDRIWGYSVLPDVNTSYLHHYDSRLLTINLTWHVGGTLKQLKKIHVEEQQRL